jgi:hypothetical protein
VPRERKTKQTRIADSAGREEAEEVVDSAARTRKELLLPLREKKK